jgi:hypothetical protein
MASYLRLVNFKNTLTLSSDQALAFLVADRFVNHGYIILNGPLTSINKTLSINILPPTYYYFISLFYFLFRNDIIVSYCYAMLGISSVFIIFLLCRISFNTKTALIASLLFSYSYEMVKYSRNIWEPHAVPCFIIICLFFLMKGIKKKEIKYFLLSNLSFFISLMYVSSYLIAIPYFMITFFIYFTVLKSIKKSLLSVLMSLIIIVIFYLPLFIFEYTKSFLSWRNDLIHLFGDTSYLSFGSINRLLNYIYFHITTSTDRLFITGNVIMNFTLLVIIIFISFYIYIFKIKSRINLLIIILVLLTTGYIASGFIQENPPVTYSSVRLSVFYPLVITLIAVACNYFVNNIKSPNIMYFKIIIIILSVIYFYNNTINISSYLIPKKPESYLKPFEIAKYILDQSDNNYSIYTISPKDRWNYYSMAIWYALEKITNSQLVTLNQRFNLIEEKKKLDTPVIYLICYNYPNNQNIINDCLNKYIHNNSLNNSKVEKKVIEEDIKDVSIYKIVKL